MTYLLDVNVLIALIDPQHVHHHPAHDWFSAEGHRSWATCPLVENGLLRIVGHPRYVNFGGLPHLVAEMLAQLKDNHSAHQFWADEVSILDASIFDRAGMLNSMHLTDIYLHGLAKFKGGKLATFDGKFPRQVVLDALDSVHLIAG
jgi:toxin-antitoxin system PIN domain toxin